MLTIFSIPKPFRGHSDLIQRNAITSWTRLSPRPEIILLGNEDGTAETARRLALLHVPDVRCNGYGTPLLNDVFEKAQGLVTRGALCYVNADILLLSDFAKAVEQVASWRDRFLMVGRRTNLDVNRLQDFDSPECEAQLRRLASEKGKDGGEWAIDYFVFTPGLYPSIPPFAVGRPAFDNWLIWMARSSKAPVVDASAVVLAIHQNHDYSHHPQGEAGAKAGEEALGNRKLAGEGHTYTLDYTSHKLTPRGIKSDARGRWLELMTATESVRHRLGLRRHQIVGLMARIGLTRG